MTALSELIDTQVCTLILTNGKECEGSWNKERGLFFLFDADTYQIGRAISNDDIVEWWPAGSKFR